MVFVNFCEFVLVEFVFEFVFEFVLEVLYNFDVFFFGVFLFLWLFMWRFFRFSGGVGVVLWFSRVIFFFFVFISC